MHLTVPKVGTKTVNYVKTTEMSKIGNKIYLLFYVASGQSLNERNVECEWRKWRQQPKIFSACREEKIFENILAATVNKMTAELFCTKNCCKNIILRHLGAKL